MFWFDFVEKSHGVTRCPASKPSGLRKFAWTLTIKFRIARNAGVCQLECRDRSGHDWRAPSPQVLTASCTSKAVHIIIVRRCGQRGSVQPTDLFGGNQNARLRAFLPHAPSHWGAQTFRYTRFLRPTRSERSSSEIDCNLNIVICILFLYGKRFTYKFEGFFNQDAERGNAASLPRKIRMRSLSQHQRENLEWVEHVIVDGHELSGNLFQSTDL